MINLEARSLVRWSITDAAELFNQSFTGYLVPLRFTPEMLAERVVVEAIDLVASFAVIAEEPAGIALIARRGGRARVAGMGTVPSMRRRGVGRWALKMALHDAEARGDRELMLEVIETNSAARSLYEQAGFAIVRRLVGHNAMIEPADAAIEEVHPSELGRRMIEWGVDEMAWQISAEAALEWRHPTRCFTLDRATFAVVTAVDDARVSLRGILTAPDRRREGRAKRLLRAIAARHPGRRLSFPPLFPEDASPEFFARLGFEHDPLAQLEMRRGC